MVVDKVGEPAGKTTQTDTSSNAQSRQVARSAERKARARSPSPKTAYPSAFSQRRPLSRMNQTFGPNRTDPSNAIFMPRMAGSAPDFGRRPALRISRYFRYAAGRSSPAPGAAESWFSSLARARSRSRLRGAVHSGGCGLAIRGVVDQLDVPVG